MRQQAMGFMKGMGAGLLAGAAVIAVGSSMMRHNRGFRRRADKTLRNVDEVIDDIGQFFH